MPTFRVWAPIAERVDLLVDGRAIPMTPGERGWWEASADAGPGSRYGFCLDGSDARPDPRSPFQPDGVDDLSELIDHDAFAWTDHGWRGVSLPGTLLYELHVGTFTDTGTFDAVADKLDHLVELGVDAVELMPVVEFSGDRGWGYDGVDLFAPHHVYGGPDGLKRLVDSCHGRGIGVVVDIVYNHLGPAGNFLAEFGPYFSERHQTLWGAAMNFDGPGSDEVRRFVVDNVLMWLREYHVDGLRLDAVHAIVDESARHVLEELAEEVHRLATHLRRPLFLIAESDRNDPRPVRSRDAGGFGLDALWADDWHHALHAALTGERSGYYEDFGRLDQLAKALRQGWVYDGGWSPHRQRHHGRPPTGLAGDQFVVSTQNHDQVGNRAAGERSSALMTEGRVRIAAALLLCGPFTPLLFQGEEWAATTPFQYFTDHRDADLAQAVSDGRRREFAHFGWCPDHVPDPQAASTFKESKLKWTELERPPQADILDWYRQLVRLRRSRPDLTDPRLDRTAVDVDEQASTLVITRGRIRLLVNLGDGERRFPRPDQMALLAASESKVRVDHDAVVVPADSVAVLGPPNSSVSAESAHFDGYR